MNVLIFFFSALGVFNGFLLSLYLIFFAKKKSVSKVLLGALVLSLSIRIGKSVLIYFDQDSPLIFRQIGLSACIFIGPLLFYYVRNAINPLKPISSFSKGLLIFLLSVFMVVGFFKSYQHEPAFWNDYMVNSIYIVWLIGLICTAYILIPFVTASYKEEGKLNQRNQWLVIVYLANALIAGAFFLALFGNSWAYYMTGPMVFSFFLYLMAFGYFNQKWFDLSNQESVEKYKNKKIDSARAEKLLRDLNDLILAEKIFVNPSLKLSEVAGKMEMPSHQLSQLLNDNLGKTFNRFINEYRIEEACKILLSEHNMSLEGIGYEVGFRSKSTFFTAFKNYKDLTPSQFQKQMTS